MTELLLRVARLAVALLAIATAVVVVPAIARSDFDPLPAAGPGPSPTVVARSAPAASSRPAPPAPTAAPAPSPTAPDRLYLLPPPSAPAPGRAPTVDVAPTATPGPAGPAPDPAPSAVEPRFGGSTSGPPTLLGDDVGTTAPAPPQPLAVPYRVEVRTDDPETAGAAAVIDAILADARGWSRAGYVLQRNDAAPYAIVLAEGEEVDALCAPYDTESTYSCQNGGTVALNADRWRSATPEWTGDLASYREYLVNHEVGHLLGQSHVDCPAPGQPSPIMVQQSTELDGCLPNGWPLDDDVTLAARRDRPLAPGPE